MCSDVLLISVHSLMNSQLSLGRATKAAREARSVGSLCVATLLLLPDDGRQLAALMLGNKTQSIEGTLNDILSFRMGG